MPTLFDTLHDAAARFGATFRRWSADERGNMALVFGVASLTILGVTGSAIDYSRKLDVVARAQGAVDAAALAIAASPQTSMSENQKTADRIVASALFRYPGATVKVTQPTSGTYRVDLSHSIPAAFMKFAGVQSLQIAVKAEAAAGVTGPVEVALALDNTGSMRNDMPALRSAAASFASKLFAQGGSNVKMSVVPYVAAVNPGANTWPLWMIDTTAQSAWHGYYFTWDWIASEPNCTPNWMTGPSGGGGGGSPGSSSSGDRSDAIDILLPMTRFASKLFGVGKAQAQTTANTISPLSPDPISPTDGFFIPKGFHYESRSASGDGCAHLVNTDPISHLDLFARMPGTAWKGCVEARPSSSDQLAHGYGAGLPDYDVTDDPPNAADPNSLFVPYFWPDESDYLNNVYNAPGTFPPPSGGGFHNNYLADGSAPATWSLTYKDIASAPYYHEGIQTNTLFKYNGTAPSIIRETGNADTYGPNASCPDPLLRLTNNAAVVDAKINSLSFWTGGGTVISEGLMWAWRTLSPNMPFADGKAYATSNRKAIVLMTDGINGLADNNIWSGNVSDYSAYGYLGMGRQGPLTPTWAPVWTFDAMTSFLDARTRAACTNAKAKGIEIYTVFFNRGSMSATQQASSRQLLKDCATAPQSAFEASDATGLTVAFAQVGAAFGQVRLIK